MLFHTWTFAVFFLLVYPAYLLVKETRLKIPLLFLASYVFYGWWNPNYLVLLFYASAIDYVAVAGMSRSRGWGKTAWLVVSLVNNLGLLGFFKYGNFVIDNVNLLAAWLGSSWALPRPDISFISDGANRLLATLQAPFTVPRLEYLLPIGISFHVFQSLSYTIDYYRGKVEKESNFLRYATFVSFFPQLVAGPIERASNLLPQLQHTPPITREDVADGLSLFLVGLFKKIALADYLAVYVNQVYGSPSQYQAPALILATVAFAWQIYFDFSGYTDMARGIGRAMGFRLMLNFNNPYLATGLGDFWRRWHISLSSWFRDYVYIPLGGNRRGDFNTYRNLFLTMVVSGLWHGAMWTFIEWGAIHGLGYALSRPLESSAFYRERVPVWLKRLWVFAFVCVAWVFFRAQSLSDASLIFSRIFQAGWGDPACPLLLILLVAAAWLYEAIYESRYSWTLRLAPVRIGLAVAMVVYLAAFAGSKDQAFIYFQF